MSYNLSRIGDSWSDKEMEKEDAEFEKEDFCRT